MDTKSASGTASNTKARRANKRDLSYLEVVLFALIFVTIVFIMGTAARADEAPVRHLSHTKTRANPETAALASQTTYGDQANLRTLVQKPRPSAFTFTGVLSLETTRTLDKDSATNYQGNFQLTPTLTYNPWNLTGSLLVLYTREYVFARADGSPGGFDDVRYSLKKAWKTGSDFDSKLVDEMSFGIGGFVPANSLSIQRQFRGSVGPRLGFMKKISKFTLTATTIYTRAIYKYDLDTQGQRLFADSYTNVLGVAYNFTDKLKLTTNLEYSYLVDFQQYTSGAERAILTLDYKWFKNFSTAAGVATIRSTIDPMGQTEAFKFYEPESSVAFFDLVISV